MLIIYKQIIQDMAFLYDICENCGLPWSLSAQVSKLKGHEFIGERHNDPFVYF